MNKNKIFALWVDQADCWLIIAILPLEVVRIGFFYDIDLLFKCDKCRAGYITEFSLHKQSWLNRQLIEYDNSAVVVIILWNSMLYSSVNGCSQPGQRLLHNTINCVYKFWLCCIGKESLRDATHACPVTKATRIVDDIDALLTDWGQIIPLGFSSDHSSIPELVLRHQQE